MFQASSGMDMPF